MTTTWIQLPSGDKFDYVNPSADQIHGTDIAWMLGGRGRYLNGTKEHYSVAEHCCILADHAMKETGNVELTLWALLHDAPEAYVPDFPRPYKSLERVKQLIEAVEKSIMSLVSQRFGLSGVMPNWVDVHDRLILHDEALQVFDDPPIDDWHEEWAPGIGATINFWDAGKASRIYITKLRDLLQIRLGAKSW